MPWISQPAGARILLIKDSAITALIAAVALYSLTWRRPLIALIRRDLSGDRSAFETKLNSNATQTRLYRA